MNAGVVLAIATVRARRTALLGLAALVAAGLGVSLAAFAIAARTDRAYDRYLDQADVGDLVVNPSLSTARADEIITGADGVVAAVSDELLNATFDDGSPRPQFEVDNTFVHVHVSRDGRFVSQDRPIVREGRMLRGGAEAVIDQSAAEKLGVGVGDPLPMAFWFPSYNTPGIGPGPDDIVSPIGRVDVTIVGIVVFADEVLPEKLYPIGRVLVTHDVAAPFTCDIGDITAIDDTIESLATIVSQDCSLSYRYYSLQVEGGSPGAVAVAAKIAAAFEEENLRLPTIARENNIGYEVIPTFTEEERVALDRARSPGVTALRLFGTAAGAATVALALLSAFRMTRRVRPDALIWRQLGVAGRTRMFVVASSLVAAALAGVAGALVIGWVASGLGPIGSSALLEVGTHRWVPVDVVALVGGIGGMALLLGMLGVAGSLALRPQAEVARARARSGRLTSRLRPAAALGVRAATSGASAGVVLVGGIVAVGVVVASIVFAGNVSTLLSQSERYGWPFDAAVVVGFGYGGGDEEVITEALDRPEVEQWGSASLGSVVLDGLTVGGVASLRGEDDLGIRVLRGRLPHDEHEVAVGAQTLADLGADLGDTVELDSSFGGRTAAITGTVVLPAIGPYESLRAESGRGALLAPALYFGLVDQMEQRDGIEPGSLAQTGFIGFVGIDLAEGVDPTAFLADLGDRRAWDLNDFNTLPIVEPVRPPALEEAATVQHVPVALGGLLAAAMAGGLALGVALATRGRRRELAVLRALGCAGADLRSTVRWHAMTVALLATMAGVPLGIVAGRVASRDFFGDLGVADDAVVPAVAVCLVVAAALLIGLLASLGPGRRAAALPASTGQDTAIVS